MYNIKTHAQCNNLTYIKYKNKFKYRQMKHMYIIKRWFMNLIGYPMFMVTVKINIFKKKVIN